MKARQKLGILRRLRNINLNKFQLYDVYIKEVRSILELSVPVWHPGLTRQQTSEIESVQKIAFRIILGSSYLSYKQACALFQTDTLEQRRQHLCLKFALKNLRSENSMVERNYKTTNTRRKPDTVKPFKTNSVRFQRTSLPYMATLINNHLRSKNM